MTEKEKRIYEKAYQAKKYTNKHGGYKDNPEYCECIKKCVLILTTDRGNEYLACKDVVLKCNFDTSINKNSN